MTVANLAAGFSCALPGMALFAACWAVALARLALPRLLLVPFALAIFIAASVLVLLASAARSAVQAMLRVGLAAPRRWHWKGLTTSTTGEPILLRPAPCLVSSLVLSFFLACFACHAFRREGDHARIELARGLAGAARSACEFTDGLAASQAFLGFHLF